MKWCGGGVAWWWLFHYVCVSVLFEAFVVSGPSLYLIYSSENIAISCSCRMPLLETALSKVKV